MATLLDCLTLAGSGMLLAGQHFGTQAQQNDQPIESGKIHRLSNGEFRDDRVMALLPAEQL
jgi:hypothetical protein